jgi:hypothetical protein
MRQIKSWRTLVMVADEFNPFELFMTLYFSWPVILTVYNLPPEICMRLEFMFLSTIIPSCNSLGRNIDVCLQLLIDELKQLWLLGLWLMMSWGIYFFSNEGSFDVDYKWFSCVWDGFWLEHAWKTSMFILYEK